MNLQNKFQLQDFDCSPELLGSKQWKILAVAGPVLSLFYANTGEF